MPEEFAARFVVDGKGFAVWQNSKRMGDATFQRDGRTVLLPHAQASKRLAEAPLDLTDMRPRKKRPREGEWRRQ